MHAARVIHYLTRAILLSLASVALGFAWLCCWLDRFRSNRGAAWITPARASDAPSPKRHVPVALDDKYPVRVAERSQQEPRTIDSLIRSRGVRV